MSHNSSCIHIYELLVKVPIINTLYWVFSCKTGIFEQERVFNEINIKIYIRNNKMVLYKCHRCQKKEILEEIYTPLYNRREKAKHNLIK